MNKYEVMVKTYQQGKEEFDKAGEQAYLELKEKLDAKFDTLTANIEMLVEDWTDDDLARFGLYVAANEEVTAECWLLVKAAYCKAYMEKQTSPETDMELTQAADKLFEYCKIIFG